VAVSVCKRRPRTLVRDIVHDNDTVRAAVVRRSDRAETLLAGRVPDLQLDRLAFQLDRADLEIDADRRDVRLGVRVVCKTQQKTRLTDARVADQQQLEQVVVVRTQTRHGRVSQTRCADAPAALTPGI